MLKQNIINYNLFVTKVFFIDHGHIEWVHWEDLRVMPTELKLFDPIAIKCKLEGCYPTLPNNQWTFEAVDTFKQEITKNETFRIIVENYDEYFLNLVQVEVFGPYSEPLNVNKYMFNLRLASIEKTPYSGTLGSAINVHTRVRSR